MNTVMVSSSTLMETASYYEYNDGKGDDKEYIYGFFDDNDGLIKGSSSDQRR